MRTDTSSAYTAITKPPNWHGLVAWDMLFNGLTTGLFLVAALGELAAPATFTTIATTAYPIAWLLLVADLICLVLDLGDPLRFHHMLRVFKPGSPMSLGTWCLTIFSLPLTFLAAITWLPAEGAALDWIRRGAVIAGLLPAFGAAAYKGVLFSTTAQPGWKDARWLGAYLTTSAFLLGAGGLLVLSSLAGNDRAAQMLNRAVFLLLLLNAMALALVAADMRATLTRVYTRWALGWLGGLVLGGGGLAALGMLIRGGVLARSLAVLLIVMAALIVRLAIVRLPHAAGRGVK